MINKRGWRYPESFRQTAIERFKCCENVEWLAKGQFVYLAVVLDKFSRKVVGGNRDRTLTARLALVALEMALEGRSPVTGLVHHSDSGVQYAHTEYLRTLRNHGVIPSVSRLGRPYDNGTASASFER